MSSFMDFGSRWITLAERSHSSFMLFVSVCVQVPLSPSGHANGDRQWKVQVGVLESMLEPVTGVVC
jgi:hypothetical protein